MCAIAYEIEAARIQRATPNTSCNRIQREAALWTKLGAKGCGGDFVGKIIKIPHISTGMLI